jgi:DNA ligase (NAD+)
MNTNDDRNVFDRITQQEYLTMIDQANECSKDYYIRSVSSLSDVEYDDLIDHIGAIEERYPEWIVSYSPTQRVAPDPVTALTKASHVVPMLSLKKTYEHYHVRDFFNSMEGGCVIEPKVDGVSLELVYRNGTLARAITRGNGYVGNDVTHAARTIKTIPIRLGQRLDITVRGEVYISKQDSTRLGYSNPRNVASGSLMLKDPSEIAERPLRFVAWDVIGSQRATHESAMDVLLSVGINPLAYRYHACNIEELYSAILNVLENIHEYPYEIDGVVIKADSYQTRDKAGYTQTYPRWAIAYKTRGATAQTTITSIQWTTGTTGKHTPVATVDPVLLAGTTIKRVSLYSQRWIDQQGGVKVGDTVTLELAGSVVPKIVRVNRQTT